MWRKVRPFVLAVSIALNLALLGTWGAHAVVAHLRGRPGGRGEKQHEIWSPLHRELGVTKEQWEKIEPEMLRFQREVREQGQKLKNLREKMFEILRAPQVDEERMEAQQQKILRGHRSMQDIVLGHILTQKRLLTDSQQEKLFEMLRRRMRTPGPGGPMMGPRKDGRGVGGALRGMNGETPQ